MRKTKLKNNFQTGASGGNKFLINQCPTCVPYRGRKNWPWQVSFLSFWCPFRFPVPFLSYQSFFLAFCFLPDQFSRQLVLICHALSGPVMPHDALWNPVD